MLHRTLTVLVLSTAFAVSAQAAPFLSLSGMVSLAGVAGTPPGYVGPAVYNFAAQVAFTPNPVGSVAAVTSASVQVFGAGLPSFTPPNVGSTVTFDDNAGDDIVTVNLFVTPLSNFVMTFTNANNLFSGGSFATEQHILNTAHHATSGVTSGSFFTALAPPVSVDGGSVSVAPEPSSFALLGVLSVAGAGWYRRRKKAS